MKSKKIKSFVLMVLCLAILMTVYLGGCSPSRQTSVGKTEKEPLTITTSFYPIYIMALNIVQDVQGVELINIASPDTGCLHDIQLSPADLKLLEKSDIFIINGLGMESYLTEVIERFPSLQVVDSSKTLGLDSADPDINAHTWVSITLAIEQVKSIGEQLGVLDLQNKEQYMKNTDQYVAKLQTLRDKMHQEMDGIRNRDIITFHEAFPYFAQEFNLNIRAVIQREPGSEPSAKELADTIQLIRQDQVKAIFVEPQYPDSTAQAIARETGVKVYTLDPVVTGPLTPDAYIQAMEKNLAVLLEALKE